MRTHRFTSAALIAVLTTGVLVACASTTEPPGTPTTDAQPISTPGSSASCSVVHAAPTPTALAGLPPITSADFIRGPTDAPVTMVSYCDFQSQQCEEFYQALDQLTADHPKDLRIVLRPFPVPTSVVPELDKSELATKAALAASKQTKFWEMWDLLHGHYDEWRQLSPADFAKWLETNASALGLNATQFQTDIKSTAIAQESTALYETATALGISAIPTVFINGRLQQRPAFTRSGLESTIGLIALGQRQFTSCPPFDIDPSKQYTATLHTVKGEIVLRLFPDKAPLAVNSFVFLARHGWFAGATFHRVIPGFVAQAGDPSGTGQGGPGYIFDNETNVDVLFDKPGVVGMANAGPDTNGSQFFITYAPAPQLDGSYTIFGSVIEGMDVVESLTPRDPQASPDAPPGDAILGVTIEER
jgi:cyclophilin family peptidyl-prolyl cis-trans isomerase/protein-disulfide isomerase